MKCLKESQKTATLLLTAIFCCMMILNFLTPYICDDWVYRLNFVDKEPLENLKDVIQSMYLHCFAMNGRVVSHSLEQIFMLLPKAVFNFCNAGVFTLTIYLMYRIANQGRKRNCFLLAALFMGLWWSLPAFGQVALWQVGSVNYLWALTLCLMFLLPYFVKYMAGRELILSKALQAMFCLVSVLFGMYSEITSFVGIYLAVAMLLLCHWVKGCSLKSWLWLPPIFAAAGYCIMLSMPAQLAAKMAGRLSFSTLWNNCIRATEMLLQYCWPLLLIWLVAFVLGWYDKIGKDRLWLAVLLLTGALGGNYMTMAASYYPERCLCTTVMLLLLAISVLLAPIERKRLGSCAWCALAVVFAFSFVSGVQDIENCWQQFRQREASITSAKEMGETNLVLDIVVPETQYSPFWDLRDLSTVETQTWPNSSMAKYYVVESILGKNPEK